MYGLPPGDAPETARIDLGGSRRTHVNRRTPFATPGNAKEAVGCSIGALEFADSLSAIGALGAILSTSLIF
jgi:hypothetical protein